MVVLAYTLFLGNFLFGLLARRGVLATLRFRPLHRILYASVLLSLGTAAIVEVITSGIPWLLLLVGAVLLGMPLFPGRKTAHAVYAVVCLVVYTAVVLG